MKAARLAAIVAVFVVAATAAGAAEPGWDAYTEGVAHVKAGRFAEGRDSLLAALKEKPEEGRFKVGVRFFDYYPSHWLAEAYLGLGDVEQAERHVKQAQGVKKVTSEETSALAALAGRIAAARGASAPPPREAPKSGPTGAEARDALAAGDVAKARRLAQAVLEKDPADAAARGVLDDVADVVERGVAAAKDSLGTGDLAGARKSLQSVLGIDADSVAARSLLQAVEDQSAKASRGLSSAEAALTSGQCAEALRLARETGRLDTSLARAASALERRARTECGAADVTPAPEPPVAEPDPAPAEAEPPPTQPAAPPPELSAALRRFFAGDVDACIESLERAVRGGDGHVRVLAALATAHATRGLTAPDAAASADLDRARELFGRALVAEPTLELDRRFVSPKIVKLLEDTRAERR